MKHLNLLLILASFLLPTFSVHADDALSKLPRRTYSFPQFGTWEAFGDGIQKKYDQERAPVKPHPDEIDGSCPSGMAHVRGKFLAPHTPGKSNVILELQKKYCSDESPDDCRHFDASGYEKEIRDRKLPSEQMNFCMDRYEYPNRPGDYPVVMVTYYEAAQLCKAEGKRMCTEDEWTFACEGEDARPYPYGYERDPGKCVTDRRSGKAYKPYTGKRTEPYFVEQVADLWRGTPSGVKNECTNEFGVYDLSGNIDEWAGNVIPNPRYISMLKGGFWGPKLNRCRVSTRAHGPLFSFYQIGFRCCGNAK